MIYVIFKLWFEKTLDWEAMIVEWMKKDQGPVPDLLLLVFIISKTGLIARHIMFHSEKNAAN